MRKVQPNGFTLYEVMLVLALVGILASVAFWTVDVTDMRLDGASRELGFTLLAAQNKAVLRQYDVLVRFDAQNGRVRVVEDVDGDGLADADEPAVEWHAPEGVTFGRGSAPALGFGATAVTFRERNDAPQLVFHRNGSASEWGGLYLRSSRPGKGNRERVRAIEVDRGTGRLTWWRYTPKGWERL